MIKPDGVQRGLVGEIISRFEKKGFKLVQLKMMKVTKCAGCLHACGYLHCLRLLVETMRLHAGGLCAVRN